MPFALDQKVKTQLHGLQMNDGQSSLTLGAPAPVMQQPASQPTAAPKKTLG